jgi:ADP-ribose pyrophosphatase
MERWLTEAEIYKGKIFSLWGGKVALDNGATAVREYVRHPGGVAIVPVLDDRVILIRQFRVAIARELLELPAGLLDPDEAPIHCAARGLQEEVGYRAQELIPLASYFSSVGFADERMHIYLALGLKKTKSQQDVEERIHEVVMPENVIRDKLAAREFEDAKTIIGLREFLAYRASKQPK